MLEFTQWDCVGSRTDVIQWKSFPIYHPINSSELAVLPGSGWIKKENILGFGLATFLTPEMGTLQGSKLAI